MKSKDKPEGEELPEVVRTHIEHLERVRRDFVANVSHELRTPLTVIRGYLESLLGLDQEAIKPWKKIYTQMYQHCMRMENLIEDLLLLSRLETDAIEKEVSRSVAIAPILKGLCQDAKLISGEANHIIRLKADSHLGLEGIEDELKSLFSNIIVNAIKYTPPHGRIDIKWFQDAEGQAIFQVTDTGIGISEDDIPRITERFYRVDKARSRESGGTGLGLAIVKHVLIRHQGELKIESQLGKGSTFICVFPPSRASVIKLS